MEQKMEKFPKKWWQKQVVYQIYPRSFKDSNADGIGDIRGIIEKLSYLKFLGIKMVWLNPIYSSPNDDNGYDISDFKGIMSDFGNMSDFDELLSKAHECGIKIVMDLVLNHTSDEHPWFIEAKSSKTSDKRDYYIWEDPKPDGSAPTNWGSFFGTSAWEYEPSTNQYYMHIFSKKMPDLNWENESLQREINNVIKFWLDKGVDGLRLDAIAHLVRNKTYQDAPNPHNLEFVVADAGNYANLPGIHEHIQNIHEEVLSNYDVFTVGEAASANIEEGLLYTTPERNELNTIIHFHHTTFDADETNPFISGKFLKKSPDFSIFQRVMEEWTNGLYGKGWQALFLNNHDMPRMLSRYGNITTNENRVKSAKMLAALVYLQWGIPFMLQGEEIGMVSELRGDISQYRDPENFVFYEQFIKQGMSKEEALELLNNGARDGSRSPMQWNAERFGGFSTTTPWIDINSDYLTWNVEDQINDKESILHFYKEIIKLKQEDDLFIYGTCEFIKTDNKDLFIYKRCWQGEIATILCNTGYKKINIEKYQEGETILSNQNDDLYLNAFGVIIKRQQCF